MMNSSDNGYDKRGQTVVFTSARGGSGVSTILRLVAGELASKNYDVCVLDIDSNFSDWTFSNVVKDDSIRDLLVHKDSVTPESLEPHMTMTPDGYMLIDTSGVGKDALTSDVYDGIITMLRTMFDIVLVNVGSDYRHPMNIRHVYPIADQIVYVATPLRYTISDMFLWVKYVTTRGIKAKNVLLTMNMCRKNGYSVKAIESLSDEFLPAQARGVMPFVASLPFLDDITGAWNNDTSDASGFTRFLGDDRISRALDPLIYAIDDNIRG